MKLDEAIRLKEEYRDNHYIPLGSKIAKADDLSIEALKARKIWQDNEGFDPAEALPGETEE